MRIRTPREQRIHSIKTVIRWILYYMVILLCFLVMTSGTWMKPMLLVPAAIAIAANSGQYGSALAGAVCGFLTDIACGKRRAARYQCSILYIEQECKTLLAISALEGVCHGMSPMTYR